MTTRLVGSETCGVSTGIAGDWALSWNKADAVDKDVVFTTDDVRTFVVIVGGPGEPTATPRIPTP